MPEPLKHINYSFEDIQRYLQGKLSAAEMHDIEKAALQDPFLADAIEGYTGVDLNKAKLHLNEINAGLFAENKKSKVVAFNNRTRWLGVAAAIILIAGISIFSVYLLNSSNKQDQVAQVKKESSNTQPLKDSAAEKVNTSPAGQDTTRTISQNKKRPQAPVISKKENAKGLAPRDKNVQADETTTMMAVPPASHENEYAAKSFKTPPLSNAGNDSLQGKVTSSVSAINFAGNTFSGKVVDEANKPVAGAVVESADKKTVTITNLSGDFVLQKNDSILNVTAGTVGYETQTAGLQTGNNNTIVLKANSSALNDVVVTGYNTKAKTPGQAAMPVGGWQNFNNYVLSQLNKDTTTAPVSDADDLVEMEFLIDNAGNPYDIKIVKPLDDQRNAKAIEILRSGPKWTNTSKNKKTRVAISF